MDLFEQNELKNNKTPNIKVLKERITVVAPLDLVEKINLRAKKNQRSMSAECLSLIIMGIHRYEILDTFETLETNLVVDPLIEKVVDPIVGKIVEKVVEQIIPLTTIGKNEETKSIVEIPPLESPPLENPNVTTGDIIDQNEFDYQKILEEVEDLSRDFKENPDLTIKKYPLTKSNYFKYVLWYNQLIKTKDSFKTNESNQDLNTRKKVLEKFRNKLNSIQRRWQSVNLELKNIWFLELTGHASKDLIPIP